MAIKESDLKHMNPSTSDMLDCGKWRKLIIVEKQDSGKGSSDNE